MPIGDNAGSRPTSAKWSQSRARVQLTSSLQEQLNVKMGRLAFAGVMQVQHVKSVCSANNHCMLHSLLYPLTTSAESAYLQRGQQVATYVHEHLYYWK